MKGGGGMPGKRSTDGKHSFPLDRFEQTAQVGGITTAMLDNGPGRGNRIAMVNTGGGLNYTVALDRGADIVNATHHARSLAFLSCNGLKLPDHAFHNELEWLTGWPGGLLTTCGPEHFGGPRDEQDTRTSLHGRYSSQPAEVDMLVNPEPHQGRHEMLIGAIVRDTRTFGPNIEVRRTIQSTLGENLIHVYDQTTNRDNRPVAHGLLYHCNIGWPLLDAGSRLVMAGDVKLWGREKQTAPLPKDLEGYKRIPAPKEAFTTTERGFICTPKTDKQGKAHVGVINEKIHLALEIEFDIAQVPRVMVWQHFAPGCYVMGVEPMIGTPFGSQREPEHMLELAPGESRRSAVTFRVHSDEKSIARFARHDKPLRLID
jgi:hypothetical protein